MHHLFNLLRLYGSTIGVAVVQIFAFNNAQAMHLALAKNLTPYHAAAHAVTTSISLPQLAMLNEMITGQAVIVAVIGQFKVLMLALLVVSPLVLFLREPARPIRSDQFGGKSMAATDTLRDTRFPLNHGSGLMPAVGFGTLIPDPDATRQATKTALETGFRHLDCAERYRNEDAVGAAMREIFEAGAIRREDVFVTTKLWNTNHRPERVKPAFEASLQRLQLDYIDSYLIHTPFAFRPGDEQDPRDEHGRVIYDSGVTLAETWHALERLVDDGTCGSIGLSDVTLETLQEIVAIARIKPSVVQVESHPYLPEWALLDFCKQQGIVLLAFAALGHGFEPKITDDRVIADIARHVRKTPAQVALAWAVQRGTAFLTTSTAPHRIQENFDIAALPEDALREIRERITTQARFNTVVRTGVPGFIPRA